MVSFLQLNTDIRLATWQYLKKCDLHVAHVQAVVSLDATIASITETTKAAPATPVSLEQMNFFGEIFMFPLLRWLREQGLIPDTLAPPTQEAIRLLLKLTTVYEELVAIADGSICCPACAEERTEHGVCKS